MSSLRVSAVCQLDKHCGNSPLDSAPSRLNNQSFTVSHFHGGGTFWMKTAQLRMPAESDDTVRLLCSKSLHCKHDVAVIRAIGRLQ